MNHALRIDEVHYTIRARYHINNITGCLSFTPSMLSTRPFLMQKYEKPNTASSFRVTHRRSVWSTDFHMVCVAKRFGGVQVFWSKR